ncbi:MAG TPA: nucleotidyltransferase family protein [Terriglobia bacterium]|nr:nucleotidyltransferase family protein [Terriglobia bacterium]
MSQGAIAGLVLAAGESSRMGQDKALLEYRGRTFLENILHTLHSAGIGQLAVVLGHHAEEIRQQVNLSGVEVIVNHSYRQGQTSSLQAGLRALLAREIEAILLCLVDHPAIKSELIQQVCQAYQESRAPVVVPRFQGRRGHPVLIGRALFQPLLKLKPVEGANTVLRQYRDQGYELEVNDPGVLWDIDDPTDYRRLVEET